MGNAIRAIEHYSNAMWDPWGPWGTQRTHGAQGAYRTHGIHLAHGAHSPEGSHGHGNRSKDMLTEPMGAMGATVLLLPARNAPMSVRLNSRAW